MLRTVNTNGCKKVQVFLAFQVLVQGAKMKITQVRSKMAKRYLKREIQLVVLEKYEHNYLKNLSY